jgi:transposase-like protein
MMETLPDNKKYSDAKKQELAYQVVVGEKSTKDISEEYGVAIGTVQAWVRKYMPDGLTLTDMRDMTNAEIAASSERGATIATMLAVQRIVPLISGEKDIDKLSRLIKELRTVTQQNDPGEKKNPWAIQVNVAIQNELKEQK